jgi:hypothetical protein
LKKCKKNCSDSESARVPGLQPGILPGDIFSRASSKPVRAPSSRAAAVYPGHPLFYADPELSRLHFEALLSRRTQGVVLAAIDLDNEIS